MTDDQIKELREKSQTAESAFPGRWYSIGPHSVLLQCYRDSQEPEAITPLVINGHIREGDFEGEYELFCEYAVLVQPSVIRKLLHERNDLIIALRDISEMTDPDGEDNYRVDDGEGCLDTVHSVAKSATVEAIKEV